MRPSLIDSTLREGQQAAGVRFDVRASQRIAELLVDVGVDSIECGHPYKGPLEKERVRALAQMGLGVPILAHARANPADIEAVADAGAQWVGIFLGINKETQFARLGNRSVEEILDRISRSIEFARSLGLKIRYTAEDGSRTPQELLTLAFRRAADAGASRLTFSDTVGSATPAHTADVTKWMVGAFPEMDVEVHLHDDRGLSCANALAAVQAGAQWISCSVNGLGERCGITDLATLMANLDFEGIRPLQNPKGLQVLSRVVAAYSRAAPDPRRPVIGDAAFTHIAKLHTTAVLRAESSYSWINPRAVGREARIGYTPLPSRPSDLIVHASQFSSEELRHHRAGPGRHWMMLDDRALSDARQCCIVRQISETEEPGHADVRAHLCDSLLMFIGSGHDLKGLTVDVVLEGENVVVESPASVFVPAGVRHSYRVMKGSGLSVNHVLAGEYHGSLLG